VTAKPSRGTIRATRASVGAGKKHIVVGAASDSAANTGSSSPETGVSGDIATTVGRAADKGANGRLAVGPAIVITVGGIITARITDTSEIEVSRGTRCEAIITSAIVALPVTASHTMVRPVAGSVIITVSAAADRSLFTARVAAAQDGIGWRGAASDG
jgi:hypothetical protein